MAMWHEERPNLFRIEIPLPGNPLKALNSYLIRGPRRSLLVDNGFNMEPCRLALEQALQELDTDRANLDFFITHLHSDHNGLTSHFITPESRIFCSRQDGNHINRFITHPEAWINSLMNLGRHGFPRPELEELASTHPGKVYASSEPLPFTFVEEGDVLEYGPYSFKALAMPGHTPGQMCLYEPGEKFLISGDHILGSITPNITCWADMPDSLGTYLDSLEKVDALDVGISYPGHRAIVPDTHARIEELRRHHAARLAEACKIAKDQGPINAWDVASQMRWSLRGNWDDYAVNQKCFATGEAIAHLDHLVCKGLLAKNVTDNGDFTYM